MKRFVAVAVAWTVVAGAGVLCAQEPPQSPTPGRGAGGRGQGRGGGGLGAFPEHTQADPAVIARGKALFGVNCQFCHGADARGGEGGPNLIRSELVLNDQNGERIAPVVQNGRPAGGMPALNLTDAQISDIAAFLHSFRVNGRDASRDLPPTILVGDAKAGEQYFQAKCAACHSATGDLKGLAARIADPKTLQQTWLAPGGGGRGGSAIHVPPPTVTVTLPTGEKVHGSLVRLDDFTVSLVADGADRTFIRDGDTPKVEVHDPLEPHRLLLPVYTDKDIHNVTAYLATLK
jgi:cytochrome c oxidase cbb3-type subunit III